ncbi:MAG: sulfatase [Chitinophagaceae bacterium]
MGLSYAQQKKYNILFIAFDDLKPNLGCYGFSETITPNFDKLAESSTIFTKAYCQQAVCAPTRASLLTGLRPDKTKVWNLQTLIRSKNPDIITLPQYLRLNGYQTIGMGKIFDPRSVDKYLDSVSWSVPYFKKFKLAEGFENLAYQSYQSEAIIAKVKAGVKLAGTGKTNEVKLSTECLDIPDDAYKDGAMTNLAIQQLDKLKSSTSPFFLAVGFNKPHLPFIAPKKYWDLYDRSKISLAQWKENAVDGPEITYHNSGELRSYFDIVPSAESSKIKRLILDESKERELIHGYYACISYVDAQVGKLIDALHKNGLDKNTIVVIWGDHGWH